MNHTGTSYSYMNEMGKNTGTRGGCLRPRLWPASSSVTIGWPLECVLEALLRPLGSIPCGNFLDRRHDRFILGLHLNSTLSPEAYASWLDNTCLDRCCQGSPCDRSLRPSVDRLSRVSCSPGPSPGSSRGLPLRGRFATEPYFARSRRVRVRTRARAVPTRTPRPWLPFLPCPRASGHTIRTASQPWPGAREGGARSRYGPNSLRNHAAAGRRHDLSRRCGATP
jgi:hypothetical protein